MGALHQFIGNDFLDKLKKRKVTNEHSLGAKEVANSVVHPVTNKTITKYNKLIADPLLQDVWSRAMSK